jgi:hypothetical protein
MPCSCANVDRAAFIRKQALDSLLGNVKLSYIKMINVESQLELEFTKKVSNPSIQVNLNEYLFPYVRVGHVDTEGIIIDTEHLLQSMFGADSKFLMADVKHGKNNEALNHLGIATFSEELRRAVITSRTRFSKLDSNSYQLTLEYFFNSID